MFSVTNLQSFCPVHCVFQEFYCSQYWIFFLFKMNKPFLDQKKNWPPIAPKLDLGCVVVPWHFEFYISKCKNFLIDFLDELGNFKQKNFYNSKYNFFITFYNNGPIDLQHHWSSREMGPNQHLLSDTDCFSVLMLVTLTTFFAPQYT